MSPLIHRAIVSASELGFLLFSVFQVTCSLALIPCSQTMCWSWFWTILRSALQGPTQDAVNQTDTSFFQRCDCCTTIFALAGDESFAGSCSICNRRICYMCNASLRFVTLRHAWDVSSGEVTYTCDDCLTQEIKNK